MCPNVDVKHFDPKEARSAASALIASRTVIKLIFKTNKGILAISPGIRLCGVMYNTNHILYKTVKSTILIKIVYNYYYTYI